VIGQPKMTEATDVPPPVPTEFEEPSFDPEEMLKPSPVPAPTAEAEKKNKKRAKQAKSVYVTGIPEDIEDGEFADYFQKCGILDKDPETAQRKCKVYRDDNGRAKGDGVVHYYKPESVQLAITILDGSDIKPGFPITVQEAKYDKKKSKGGAKRPKLSKKIKRVDVAKDLGWEEDDNCNVILLHMFDQQEAWDTNQPNFFDELKEEVVRECEKFGGVKNIKVFERNPMGVVAVKFLLHPAALRCIDKMNGRFFGGKKLEAFFYDGFTDYEVKETEEQKEQRVEEWNKWLEQQDES